VSSRETPVSFVVCTHNGGQRLSLVIADLVERHQHQAAEIVVVDNASTDGAVAHACDRVCSKQLEVRVVREENLGLAHARRAGVRAATGEIVVFVDDDNVLFGDWPKRLDETFRKNPEIGACGGYGIGCLPDIPAPSWFERWCDIYAIGGQAEGPGDITEEPGHLWGAGLAVRRGAIAELFQRGFRFRATGRCGTQVLSGEDWELCFALRLAGWRLWYDPSLVFLHLLDMVRFQPDYLRKLHAGFGAGSVMLDPYEWALGNTLRFPTRRHRSVAWQLAIALRVLASPQRVASRPPSAPVEFVVARFRGRFAQLLRMGLSYDRSFAEISAAPWREKS
jgi:glycosyltransferase involved in cell wall biosynthesis